MHWTLRNYTSIPFSPIKSVFITISRWIEIILNPTGLSFGGDMIEFADKGIFRYIVEKTVVTKNAGLDAHHMRIINIPVTLVLDPQQTIACLKMDTRRGKLYDRLTDFFGQGIFTSKIKERWHHQRSLILHLNTRKAMMNSAQPLIDAMFQYLERELKGVIVAEVEIQNLLSQMGLVGFCQIIFGVDVSPKAHMLIKPLARILEFVNTAIEPGKFPFDPVYREFCRNKEIVHEWIRELIRESRSSDNCHPLIRNELRRFASDADSELVEFVQSIVLGGHETTARLMTVAIYYLAPNSTLVDRLRSELDEYLSSHSEYSLDIMKMQFMRKVLNESLRLFSPVWVLTREAQTDVILGDRVYEKGHQFILSPFVIMRDEKVWGPDAEMFNPDRFDNLTEIQRATFYPFAVGRENCPGKFFAELEASLLIFELFNRYDIEILDYDKICPYSAGTLRLTSELMVKMRHRSKKLK